MYKGIKRKRKVDNTISLFWFFLSSYISALSHILSMSLYSVLLCCWVRASLVQLSLTKQSAAGLVNPNKQWSKTAKCQTECNKSYNYQLLPSLLLLWDNSKQQLTIVAQRSNQIKKAIFLLDNSNTCEAGAAQKVLQFHLDYIRMAAIFQKHARKI